MANSVAGLTGGGGGWLYVVIMSGSITLLLSLNTQRLYSKDLTLATENLAKSFDVESGGGSFLKLVMLMGGNVGTGGGYNVLAYVVHWA